MTERRVQLYPGQPANGVKITVRDGQVSLWHYHSAGGELIGLVEPIVAQRLASAINEAAVEAIGAA